MDQDIVLVLEVQVDGTVGDAGLTRNLGNGRLVEPLFGKNPDRGFQDPMKFFMVARFTDDNAPPGRPDLSMNERSFITNPFNSCQEETTKVFNTG
ncbi:MAG: hypothetical protein RBR20_07365 [Desulfobacterales bacterium]|jgi:hypothetical protein|nr:hypothetical protein [Desulfobacteraceae bacterium]MDD3990541.1 hypothetical protein [Desulfobacteraceae bacterium]MDY0311930.1 hypothetical protein [Desulfobacterales bacterium]